MAITFSSTSGTSGVTNIEITATERLDDTNYSKNYVISNDNMSLGMTVAQKAYAPVGKYITLSPSAISWTSSESTDSITVNSNDDWVVMSDGWIELSRMYSSRGRIERVNVVSGNGNTIIGIRCSENTGSTRTGGITAYCQSDSSITATTTVSQAGGYVKPYIMLGTYSMSIGGSSATTAVSVTSNVSWSAITDSRWITINTLTGSGDGSVSFTVDANESEIERRGTITVYNGELSAVLVISQQASSFKPYIILTPDTFNVASTGSTNTITVSANCEYDIAADVPWITVNAVSGSGNGSVSFTTASNSGLTDVGNIEFSNLDISRSVSVERQGMQKYLSASTNTISCSSSGGTFNVSVYSNINWSVGVDMGEGEVLDRWLSVNPSSGSNDGSITISVGSGYTAASGSVVLSSTKYGLSWVVGVKRREPVDNTKVFYTSTGNTVINVPTTGWGANILSNTYTDGQGVIAFDGNVTRVPGYAFYQSDLSSIVLPETITYITNRAFYVCHNLEKITMPPCDIGDAWAFGWDAINEVYFLGTLEQWVTGDNLIVSSWGGNNDVIDPNGFDLYFDGELLTHADFSSYSGGIRTDAISQCKSLTGVTIGENVTYIGDVAFNCPNLVYVSYNAINAAGPTPSSYPIYNGSEFGSITTFEIGENVEKIRNMVIGSGTSLTTIYSHPRVVPDIGTAYFRAATNGTLHYPSGSDYSILISRLPSGWTAVADL